MPNYASTAIGVAKKYNGYIEKASNSNLDSKTGNKGTNNYTIFSKIVNDAGLNGCQGQAWCGTSQFAFEILAFGVDQALKNWNMTKKNYVGYNCFSTYNTFKKAGKVSKTPKLGCLVIFTFSHMGRVIEINHSKRTFKTLEGNTSSKTYERNGGMVAIKSYSFDDSKIKGFCIIDYDDETTGKVEKVETTVKTNNPVHKNVKSGQAWLNNNYGSLLVAKRGEKFVEDGDYGTKTRAGCVCVWKDVVNRKYGFGLTPSNSNFYDSCKKAAKKATLVKGASGTLTLIAQLILSANGFYNGAMDAQFGNAMDEAVKAYQRSKGLEDDGVIGANTWYALFN